MKQDKKYPKFPDIGCKCNPPDCGFTMAGVGVKCTEGTACGRYLHPGEGGECEAVKRYYEEADAWEKNTTLSKEIEPYTPKLVVEYVNYSYHAYNNFAFPAIVHDERAITFAEKQLEMYFLTRNEFTSFNEKKDWIIKVGTFIMVVAFRLMVIRGKISHEELEFEYKGERISIDSDGRLPKWPIGFADTWDNMLEELL